MEHEAWIGERYRGGFDGQKLLLFGFSHYGAYDDGHDDADFTNYAMNRWALKGEIPFFTALAGYFGETDLPAFYARIAFANTLPRSVGAEDEKFAAGDDLARAEVADRVRRLIGSIDPDKVIVFTTKGWQLFPDYDDRDKGGWLEVPGQEPVEYGGYARSRPGYAIAYGLRHPMLAPRQMMRERVAAIISAPL